MRLVEKTDWGRLVSPLSDKDLPPFNWYAYKHRFGSELVTKIFSVFDLKKGDAVFDPFCGGGTTLIKAKMHGYHSVGLDLSPFPVFLTKALTRQFQRKKLIQLYGSISHDIDSNIDIPDVDILWNSFSEDALKYIFSLRQSIASLESSYKDFFLLSLLCILNGESKAKKSGAFLRITNQRRVSWKHVKKAFEEHTARMISELASYRFEQVSADALIGDARSYPDVIKRNKFDAILTSPPYPNRHDYTRIYELELLVGFVESNDSLKKLRYQTLRSHVEARRMFHANGYSVPSRLKDITRSLLERQLNNPQIVSTIEGYFEDMYLCFKEMSTVLKRGAYVGLVVSNVRFGGVTIPVDELLSGVGEQAGLAIRFIYVLRYRGNSSQQMLRYKREPTRESLIVWQNEQKE